MNAAAAPGTDDLRDLYRELILDHARNPRGFGSLDDATHAANGVNPLCGDKLRLFLRVGPDERIEDAHFDGSGCAISVASASLLTETVSGLYTAQALDYVAALAGTLNGTAPKSTEAELGKLRALLGVRDYPSRVKCATLAWHTLRAALDGSHTDVSTE